MNARVRQYLTTTAMICLLYSSPTLANSHDAGIFSVLRIGDSISLKEVGQKFDLTKIQGAIGPYKVTVIESDFIELKMNTILTRIPVTSVRMIGVTGVFENK